MKCVQRQLCRNLFLKIAGIVFVAGLVGASCSVQAADLDGAKLVQVRRCYACHSLKDYLIGPPYSLIALRHAKYKDAMVDVMAEKIILGGAGTWGVVPMVPNEHVSWEEARAIARWILDQAAK